MKNSTQVQPTVITFNGKVYGVEAQDLQHIPYCFTGTRGTHYRLIKVQRQYRNMPVFYVAGKSAGTPLAHYYLTPEGTFKALEA